MHEYRRRLNLALSLGIIDRGTAAVAAVGHDLGCPIESGGECDCDPEIFIRTQGGNKIWVKKDGTVSSVRPTEGA